MIDPVAVDDTDLTYDDDSDWATERFEMICRRRKPMYKVDIETEHWLAGKPRRVPQLEEHGIDPTFRDENGKFQDPGFAVISLDEVARRLLAKRRK